MSTTFIKCLFVAGVLIHNSPGACIITGIALTMVLNAIVPQFAATIAVRSYAPGTATALLLDLPPGAWLLYRAITTGFVDGRVFSYVGPVVVLCVVASITLLPALGRKLMAGSGGCNKGSGSGARQRIAEPRR